MIRKTVIVALTVAAIASATLSIVSRLRGPIHGSIDTDTRSLVVTAHAWVIYIALLDASLEPDVETGRPISTATLRWGTRAYKMAVLHRAVGPAPPRWFQHSKIWPNIHLLVIRVPAMALITVFAAYPTLVLVRGPAQRYRRRKRGLCITCAYNLTGLTEPRCPECGTRINRP